MTSASAKSGWSSARTGPGLPRVTDDGEVRHAGGSSPDLAVVSMDGGRLQIRDWPSSDAALGGVASPVAATEPPSITAAAGVASPAAAVEAGPAGPAPGAEPAVKTGPAGPAPGAEPAVEAGPAGSEPSPSQVRSGHWREDKIGLLMTMTSEESAVDPCPRSPSPSSIRCEFSSWRASSRRVARRVRMRWPTRRRPRAKTRRKARSTAHQRCKSGRWWPRDTRTNRWESCWLRRGLRGGLRARRKAFLGDGAENNWTVRKRWFSDFVAILDFIHVLSYVFAVAMAGRGFATGWEVYVRWIGWVWQGRVAAVIEELEQRQKELGLPAAADSESSPRRVVAEALRYLKNHQDQMRYDEYRRQGLPITSSHVESTVKQFNRRVKGTEKFWSEEAAEAMLQLRADYLSETEPMETFWQEREARATGRRLPPRRVIPRITIPVVRRWSCRQRPRGPSARSLAACPVSSRGLAARMLPSPFP